MMYNKKGSNVGCVHMQYPFLIYILGMIDELILSHHHKLPVIRGNFSIKVVMERCKIKIILSRTIFFWRISMMIIQDIRYAEIYKIDMK